MNSLKSTFQTESRRGHPLTEEMILQACREWYAEHGKWPTVGSGDIISGVLEGNSWGTINRTFHRGGRGLEKRKYKGIADFLEQQGLKQKFASGGPYKKITEEMVLQGCHEWFARYKRWPTNRSVKIMSGILVGDKWSAIDTAFGNGGRGLEKGKYKSLADFLKQHGLEQKLTRVPNKKLTESMVLKGCHEWFAEHHKWPTIRSGEIIFGVLVGDMWFSINQALCRGKRGLEKGKYKGIADFKRQHGLVKGAAPDTAVAFARAANPDYHVPESAQDVRRSPQLPPPAP